MEILRFLTFCRQQNYSNCFCFWMQSEKNKIVHVNCAWTVIWWCVNRLSWEWVWETVHHIKTSHIRKNNMTSNNFFPVMLKTNNTNETKNRKVYSIKETWKCVSLKIFVHLTAIQVYCDKDYPSKQLILFKKRIIPSSYCRI